MKCDICKGMLVVDAGGKTASCINCGMKHSIERIREKMMKTQETPTDPTPKISEEEKKEISLIHQLINENGYEELDSHLNLEETKEAAMNLLCSESAAYAVLIEDYGIQADDFMILSEEKLKKAKELLLKYKHKPWKASVTVLIHETLKLNDTWVAAAGINQILYEFGGIKKEKAIEVMKELGELLCLPISLLDKNQQLITSYSPEEIMSAMDLETFSEEKDFVYSTDNDEEKEMKLIKEYTGKASTIVLPETESMGKLYERRPFFEHPETVKKVIFHEKVTCIGNGAFEGCVNLEEVHIPSHITFLGYTLDNPDELGYSYVFSGCENLKKVTFDENSLDADIETWNGLFKGCRSLKEVSLSNHMHSIDISMFEDCESLEEIVLPDSVTVIAQNAFKGCSQLKNVVFSHPLAIHPSAFQGTKFTPPEEYTKDFKTNLCPVCKGKLNLWSQCKKCKRIVHYQGGKKEWK